MARNVNDDVDLALHIVIGAFLVGEARVLAETVELMLLNGSGSRKLGLALWRLLRLNLLSERRCPA